MDNLPSPHQHKNEVWETLQPLKSKLYNNYHLNLHTRIIARLPHYRWVTAKILEVEVWHYRVGQDGELGIWIPRMDTSPPPPPPPKKKILEGQGLAKV